MTLNTYVAGHEATGPAVADYTTDGAQDTESRAAVWHHVRSRTEGVWEGPASEAFVANRVEPTAHDADGLAAIIASLVPAFTAFGNGLRAAKDWMERAKQVARDGELTVQQHAIQPPPKFTATTPAPLQGRVPAAEAAAHSQATAEFEAAKALHAKQEAAYTEAQAIVGQARDLERKTHDDLRHVLTPKTEEIRRLSQFESWSQAAKTATTPAAVELMSMATHLENQSVQAGRAAFEKAMAQGPYATNSMWVAMTSEQKADLSSRYPQMVGSTNGVPVVDRDIANRSILAAQKQALIRRIDQQKDNALRSGSLANASAHSANLEQMQAALDKLDDLEARLGNSAQTSENYLLAIDSTAAERGQVIISHGNPDTADHVATMVPGTFSDLSDALDYAKKGDGLISSAESLSGGAEDVAYVTYSNYESPPALHLAADGSYAHEGKESFAEFQEGLRATRDPEYPPSHNTVIGHSYGSTLIGYAARDCGIPVDDMVLVGSPGTGVDHASELLPNGQVWAGTGPLDPVPGISPDWWYGPSPADPGVDFGARQVPVGDLGHHNSYWEDPASRDGMARIVAGRGRGITNE